MQKKILITGGSGQLGLNWALQNRYRNQYILGMNTRIIELDSNIITIMIDMGSAESFQLTLEKLKPDYVVHAAAMTNVDECDINPHKAREVNVTLAANVALACNAMGIKLVHISTDHLFSGHESLLDESAPTMPVNVYAKTKAEAEKVVIEKHPKALIIRTNFFGWGTNYRRSFSDFIINTLREKKQLNLYTDVYYTPISIPALVNTIEFLIESNANGIFNLTGDERLSKCAFGYKIASVFNLDSNLIMPSKLSDMSLRIQRPLDMSLSNYKICKTIGHRMGNIDSYLQNLFLQEQQGLAAELFAVKTLKYKMENPT